MTGTPFYATLEDQGAVDDEALTELRKLIGLPLRVEQWNTEATIDNIRHYALALGDLNPLWHDPEYAASTHQGTLLAPPTFFYSIYQGLAPGLVGLAALNRTATWRYSDWARLGDRLHADARVLDAKVVESSAARRRIDQSGRIEYSRVEQDGSHVKLAEVDVEIARVQTRGQGGLDYAPREPRTYTREELDEISRRVLAVAPRGAETRYWETVSKGDPVDAVVKGPYTQMTMVCYYAAAPGSPGYRAFDAWWRNHDRAINHPDLLPNTFDASYFRGSGTSSMGHHDARVGQAIGMPGVYDNGNQRIGIMATVATNWMGDDGFLSEYRHRLRRPVILGDTLTLGGTVADTRAAVSERTLPFAFDTRPYGEVDLDLTAVNQEGELVSTGSVTVLLLRR